jgi:hypothetical protein
MLKLNTNVRFPKQRLDGVLMMNCDDSQMIRYVFDALPSIIFVVDEDVRIQECNTAAAEFLMVNRTSVLKRRGGEVLHCLHADEAPGGCGKGPSCKDCIIRRAIAKAFNGNRIVRHRARMEIIRNREQRDIYALVTASPFNYEGKPLVLLVIEDISEIAELQRMLPICSVCKKIRNDQESWYRIESYFKEYWDVDFSHSLCPQCYKIEMEKLKADIETRCDRSADNASP